MSKLSPEAMADIRMLLGIDENEDFEVIICETEQEEAGGGRNRMNDRYLFRGKNIKTGEWAVGSVVRRRSRFVCGMNDVLGIENAYGEFTGVDNNTVGQCTGLKDENGKLIFEGDIVEIDPGHKDQGIVEWNEEELWWEFGFSNGNKELLSEWKGEVKIIGNKWDGLELLEGK